MSGYDQEKSKRIEIKPYEYIKRQMKERKTSVPPDEQKENLERSISQMQEELSTLEQQKETLLKEVQTAIRNERLSWDTEKKQLTEQAQQAGHEAGFVAGEKQSLAQYATAIKKANDIIQSATKDYHETVGQSENKIIELATYTANKIIHQAIEQDRNVMLQIVKTAIKDLKAQPSIAIYVHPNHYNTLLQQKKELEHAVDGDCDISIYVDQDVTESDCRIEHPFGQIDAGIDTQLGQIHDVLQNIAMEHQS